MGRNFASSRIQLWACSKRPGAFTVAIELQLCSASGRKYWLCRYRVWYKIPSHSASTYDGKSGDGFNIGGSINPSEKFHIIFSFGHSLIYDRMVSSYIGFLWTI